jgi:aspartate/methionine/tyrosine aminotransferase
MKLADSMSRLGGESAFEVLTRARALEATGRSVIHLEIGEPDFATPPHIVEAAKRALDEGWTHYAPTPGLPELREAIAVHVSGAHGIPVGRENVVVTPGAKPILFFSILALVDPGDEVIYPDPGFPIYESMIRFAGGTPVPIPLEEARGFSFDLNVFRDCLTDKTKLVILNSPHNPTGGAIPRRDIAAMAALLCERDVAVLSDEIYTRIHFGEDPPASIASYPGMAAKTVIMDGFSKSYAMTGWRIGYGVMPEFLAQAVTKLMVNSNSCTAAFTQRAGIAALTGPQDGLVNMVREFHRRRDAFCQSLNQVPGFRCELPSGAFYAFPNVTGTGMDSKELADFLLNEAGVSCLDGGCFGPHGKGYLRFSYANSMANLMEAVERIRKVAPRWTPVAR